MIKVCVFDLGGVVTETKFDEVLIKYEEKYSWNLEELKNKIFGKEYQLLLSGKMNLEEFILWLNGEISEVSLEDLSDFAKEYYYSGVVKEEVVDLIKKIKVKKGLITNDIGQLDEKLDKLRINNLFDKVINSYQVGYCKPSLEIYKYLLDVFQIKGGSCLYIDNNVKELEVAEKLGIKPVLFKDSLQLKRELEGLI